MRLQFWIVPGASAKGGGREGPEEIPIGEVLDLLGFRPIRCTPSQLRGACPFDCHGSPRDFAAYLAAAGQSG